MQKKVLIGFLLTLAIIVFIPIYAMGEPARQERAAQRQREQAMEIGAETFVALCANCHGPQGQGLIGPALKGTNLNKETLVKVINRGRVTNRVPMPAWSTEDGGPLKKHQIDNLVLFIQNWDENILETAVVKHEALVHLPEEPAAIGKQMFTTVGCSFCHGGGAEGTNFGPPLAGTARERIERQVRQPRTPLMPAYTAQHLSDADMEKVVSFLLTLKSAPTPTPPQPSTGAPPAESQAIAQGAQLFGSLGCGACHGPEGKGTAIGSNITGKSREEISRQVRTPRGTMPPFTTGVLTDADLEKIIAFIQSLNASSSTMPTPPRAPSPTPAPVPTPVPTPAPAISPTPDTQAIAQGTQLFISRGCGACHGPEGKGTTFAPSIIGKTSEEITRQVRTPMGAMPAYPPNILSDAYLEKIVAFIQSLNASSSTMPTPPRAPSSTPAPVPTLAPTPAPTALPTPNTQAIAQGAQLFSSLGCGACHGPEGKGTTFAPNVVGKTSEEIIKQVRTPRGAMPASPANILSEADLDKLVAYIMSLKK